MVSWRALPFPARRRPGPDPRRTACFAPSVQLFLEPDGRVLPCGVHLGPLGNISRQRLPEIWDGAVRRGLLDHLARDDFSAGCENCREQIELEGADHSYAAFFRNRAGHLTADPASAAWPAWIDFNLSTTCNLQCIQCSGELSSSIRIHRERRAPLPVPYDDQFFDDLRAFIPHLRGAQFAGGEPFLSDENYRVWDLVAELNPELVCTAITNGTQWNRRVEAVLGRLRFAFVFSLDGLTTETFEAVRVGADRDRVFANVDRFTEHARSIGTAASVNHCLMVQNHHEFADLLMWAEDRGLPVKVSVVRAPASCSIARLPADRLAEVHATLLARQDEVLSRCRLNADTWLAEVARIGAWARSAADTAPSWATWGRTVMMFRCAGEGPTDVDAARSTLVASSVSGVVHEVVVGADDVIVSCDDGLLDLLSARRDEFVGRLYTAVDEICVERLGALRGQQIGERTDDRLDLVVTYGDHHLRVVMVPERDRDGWAESGRILVTEVGAEHAPARARPPQMNG